MENIQDVQHAIETGQALITSLELANLVGGTTTILFMINNSLANTEDRIMNRINEILLAFSGGITKDNNELNDIKRQLQMLAQQKNKRQKRRKPFFKNNEKA
ncbi:MAG: hypothetical protein SXA11_06920 [Cyanobacteriota bacterium]|nr:hypothetical protein [Cyanobacteriota bacterium]